MFHDIFHTHHNNHSHHNSTMDMTRGNSYKLILSFTFPLIVGNLFQQLYNTVDSVVVGNYVGKEALAAIGSTSSLINMLIGFFLGLATGAGVVVAQYFGSKEIEKLRKAVHTMIVATIILGVVFTIVGVTMSPLMLTLMSTPEDVFSNSLTYLRIYFLGSIALMSYNIGAGILRAVGDSRRPLYFLIISSLVNVILDLLFVVVFKWGIAGAALATVISEVVSVVLVFYVLLKSDECYNVKLNELKIHFPILKQIVRLGFPAGFQMMITGFSNIFVQGYINSFGSSFMAGWASYTRIDQFVFLPVHSIGLAVTTFVGQNFGAKNKERVKEGISSSFKISFTTTIVTLVFVLIFARQIVSLFNREESVVYYGTYLILLCSPFYFLTCINQIYASSLRGLGNSTSPMIIMLSSFVVFRQIYLFIITRITPSFIPVALSYPVGWSLCAIIMIFYFRRYLRSIKF